MRRADKPYWLLDEDKDNTFIGIDLSASYTAEHEHGIYDLVERIEAYHPDKYGVDRRRIKKAYPDHCALKEEAESLSLIIDSSPYDLKRRLEMNLDSYDEYKLFDKEDLVTCWSSDACMIRVKGKENTSKVKELYKALINKDLAIWLGGGQVFKNAGLCLAIITKIPEKHVRTMYDIDIDNEKLCKVAKETGIQAKIDKLKSQWYADNKFVYPNPWGYSSLRPSWKEESSKSDKTKYDVLFWLNPEDQKNNDYGWFTVEELELWLEGKGPIRKTSKS